MNTDLTDAEWALGGDLFERDGQRGAPPRCARRVMVNASAAVVAQACTKVPGQKKLCADGACSGKCAQAIAQTHGISVELVRHPGNRGTGTWQNPQQPLWPEVLAKGFVVQAEQRWAVERTHAWNECARRLMVHHDRSDWAPLAWVWLAEARILATGLAG